MKTTEKDRALTVRQCEEILKRLEASSAERCVILRSAVMGDVTFMRDLCGDVDALEEALRSLLLSGSHEEPCDNEPGEACQKHVAAAKEREDKARALLGDSG